MARSGVVNGKVQMGLQMLTQLHYPSCSRRLLTLEGRLTELELVCKLHHILYSIVYSHQL